MIDCRIGDCRDVLKSIPEKSIHCCVTSPPYFGLRDYGVSSLECACMGVPAICYIDEKLYEKYSPPFIWSDPSTLYQTIKTLYELDYSELLEIGGLERIYYFEKHKKIIDEIYR